jgi:hypothetical protein
MGTQKGTQGYTKYLAQYFNPIENYEEKTIFDEFQKFRRALTEIAVTFTKLKILRQKFGILCI